MKSQTATKMGSGSSSERLTQPPRIRILIVDDNQLLRTLLRANLETQAEYEVVGEADDGFEAVRLTKAYQPDVVIMDISMPRKDGLTAAAELTRDFPLVRVIMLSSNDDAFCVQQAIRAGAMGYLVKCGSASVAVAITAIVNGHKYFDPTIAHHVPAKSHGVN